MADHELRRFLRERELAPDDVDAARRAAIAAARNGDRELAAEAWQEVLRRAPRDPEAERRLAELGCDLVWRATDARGVDEYENVLDGSLMVRALEDLFVARAPVTHKQFQRFLVSAAPDATKRWISGRGPLRRAPFLGGWTFFGGEGAAAAFVLEASWLGAREYAAWAGGRLLREDEWDRLAESKASLEGFDLTEGEWLDGLRGERERPVKSLWDPRWPTASERGHVQWAAEDAFPGAVFRYARSSWFR